MEAMNQIPMPLSGSALRDNGIQQSIKHADAEAPGWSDRAFYMLRDYLESVGGRFQTEDVREWCHGRGLDLPPSKRAWGGIIIRAKNVGLIRFSGYENVSNTKAHCTPAACWEKV
jgi:hypothetical protein